MTDHVATLTDKGVRFAFQVRISKYQLTGDLRQKPLVYPNPLTSWIHLIGNGYSKHCIVGLIVADL